MKQNVVLLSLLWLCSAAAPLSAADPLETLRYLTPEPLPMLQDIAYGQGRWLAPAADVGSYTTGVLLVSTNGTDWARSAPGIIPEYFKPTRVTCGGDAWMLGGLFQGPDTNAPALLSSTDGVTWSMLDMGATLSGSIKSIVHGNGIWLVMTSDGSYYTSPDGTAWTPHTMLISSVVQNIVFGGGTWLATTPIGFYHSTNAIDWNPQNVGFANPVRVAYGNGRWAGVGLSGQGFVTSEDAVNWTPTQFIPKDNDISEVIYTDGTWLALGEDRSKYLNNGIRQALLWTSTNGMQWTRTLLEAYGPLRRGATDGHRTALILHDRRPGEIFTSTNLSEWTPHLKTPAAHYIDGVYADGTWLAIGSQYIGEGGETRNLVVHSTNGLDWQRVFPGEIEPGPPGDWRLLHGGGGFVLSGAGSIATSSNGIHWVKQDFEYSWLGTPQYGNGLWVMPVQLADFGEDLKLLTSTNGLHWTERVITGLNGKLFRVTFGGGRWIGQADSSLDGPQYLVTSTNGRDWSRLPDLPFNRDLFFCDYASGRWLIGRVDPSSGLSTLYTSEDASAWTPREVPGGVNPALVTAQAGRWFATGFNTQTSSPSSVTSRDGVHWELTSTSPLLSLIYAQSRWISSDHNGVASSTNGTDWVTHHSISVGKPLTDGRRVVFTGERLSTSLVQWTSPRLTLVRSGASWNLSVSGDAGATYHIEKSTSLHPFQWENAGAITLDGNSAQTAIPASSEPRSFWRARVP